MHHLEKLIKLYPFLVREYPLGPASSYKKMNAWEKQLFAEMSEDEANSMRKLKSVEIIKTDVDKVPEVVHLIRLTMQKKQQENDKAKSKMSHTANFGNVLSDIRRMGEERARRARMESGQTANMEVGEIDFTE